MDIATIIGLFMGFGLIFASIAMGGGGGLSSFIDVPSLMITVGGSFAALLINYPLNVCLKTVSVLKKCFLTKVPEPEKVIAQFKALRSAPIKERLILLRRAGLYRQVEPQRLSQQ